MARNVVDVVRAWKDAAYRNSLPQEQLATLPANPAGVVEVDEAELRTLHGGSVLFSAVCTVQAGQTSIARTIYVHSSEQGDVDVSAAVGTALSSAAVL